ncbi:MAG TPA: chemotaxis protein CheW [Mycobacteriales bacterium]|nr:chemotaxis protein CheW [Mycobacteriales bacterium]
MEQEQPGTAAPEEVVVVRLGGSRYALPMSAVAEVGRPPGLTRVPGLPAWLAGVANWRGRVLAVVDLRPLLAAGDELDRRARLVVLNRGGVPVGLLTEGVEGTQLLDPERVEAALAHLPGTAAELLLGQVTDADGPCGVLDLDAVYRLSESLPRARRAG